MTPEEAAHIDRLKENAPTAKGIATIQEECDYWIEAHRSTDESMAAARVYIDKARYDRCQDAMHGELEGHRRAEHEADLQYRRDTLSREELKTGCDPGRRDDLERWAAKLKGTMSTKLRYRKCWMQAGLKLCDREAGYDVYSFEPRRKAIGVARPADAPDAAPFSVELEPPARGKELHVLAYGSSPLAIRSEGTTSAEASPFEDKAARSESADGSFSEVGDVPQPPHATSQVIRSGKANIVVDGLGCVLVVVFEGAAVPPPGAPDTSW